MHFHLADGRSYPGCEASFAPGCLQAPQEGFNFSGRQRPRPRFKMLVDIIVGGLSSNERLKSPIAGPNC